MAYFSEICSNSYFKLCEKWLKIMHLSNILWRQKMEVKFCLKTRHNIRIQDVCYLGS